MKWHRCNHLRIYTQVIRGFYPFPLLCSKCWLSERTPQEKVKHAEDVFHSGAGDFIQLGASRWILVWGLPDLGCFMEISFMVQTYVCYIYIYDNIIYIYIYTKGDRTCNIRTCIDTYHIWYLYIFVYIYIYVYVCVCELTGLFTY